MKRLLLMLSMILLLSCGKTPQPATQATTSPQPQLSPSPASQADDEEKSAEDFFTKDEKLSHNGFDILKLHKKINYQYPDGERQRMDVSYVAVRKAQKTLATFDGVVHPVGNSADFGLFPFLGKDRKQLIVSLTVPRGGRQWIADLSPSYREIFDTADWGVGREGADLGFIDIDKDGVWEITAGDFWYYVFDEISMSETPVVNVIFHYDKRAGKYVPANHEFPEYSLEGIDDEINSMPANQGYRYLGTRIDTLLAYLYAGKEKEGWEFFEREYNAPDKKAVKAKVQKGLKNSPVYQFVRRHSKER